MDSLCPQYSAEESRRDLWPGFKAEALSQRMGSGDKGCERQDRPSTVGGPSLGRFPGQKTLLSPETLGPPSRMSERWSNWKPPSPCPLQISQIKGHPALGFGEKTRPGSSLPGCSPTLCSQELQAPQGVCCSTGKEDLSLSLGNTGSFSAGLLRAFTVSMNTVCSVSQT